MNYIRVYNESASPVVLKGILRSYVVRGRTDNYPASEDISYEDIDYINSRSDVFRTGRLKFAEDMADEIMSKLRNPSWRDTVLTDEQLIVMVTNPTNDVLRAIVACNKRPEIERYRAALVAAQNANLSVTGLVDRVIRDRFSEIANGITNTKIVLPEDYIERHTDPKVKELEDLRKQNADMEDRMAEMQKQLEALLALQTKAEKPKKAKASKTEVNKAEPTAE